MTRRPGVICFAAQDWWYHNRAHSEVQLMLRIGEKVVCRSCFGAGTGNSGDSGLRASRGGIVFAACDHQGLVLM